jgi:hypothetical protein
LRKQWYIIALQRVSHQRRRRRLVYHQPLGLYPLSQ